MMGAGAAEPRCPGGQLTPLFRVCGPHAVFDPHFLSAIPSLTPLFVTLWMGVAWTHLCQRLWCLSVLTVPCTLSLRLPDVYISIGMVLIFLSEGICECDILNDKFTHWLNCPQVDVTHGHCDVQTYGYLPNRRSTAATHWLVLIS